MKHLTSRVRALLQTLLVALVAAGSLSAQDAGLPAPAHAEASPSAPTQGLSPAGQAAVRASNALAFQLLHHLSAKDGENLLFSPYSLSTALGMTFAGADGATREQMQRALKFAPEIHAGQRELAAAVDTPFVHCTPSSSSTPQAGIAESLDGAGPGGNQASPVFGGDCANVAPSHLLRTANRLWPQQGFPFEDDYMRTLMGDYAASPQGLDYANDPDGAKDTINQWVARRTRDRNGNPMIPELLSSLEPTTRMVLTNAVYFQGDWVSAFDPQRTYDGEFRTPTGEVVKTPLMYREDVPLRATYLADGTQLAVLPFQGEKASLVVLVPQRNTEDSLAAMIAALDADSLDAGIRQAVATTLDVTFPKFGIESALQLKDALSALGMPDMFDQQRADLSRMSPVPGLFVDDVVHKATARFDEEGAEAAAATGVVFGLESLKPSLQLDRAFVLCIRDEATGTILFLGRVTNPTK